MGERRGLLGAGAVLVGMGGALLSGTAIAAADTGNDAAAPSNDNTASAQSDAQGSTATRRSAGQRTSTPAAAAASDSNASPAAQQTRGTAAQAQRARDRVRNVAPQVTAPTPASATPAAATEPVERAVPAAAVSGSQDAATTQEPATQTVVAEAGPQGASAQAPTPATASNLVAGALAALGWVPGDSDTLAAPAATTVVGQRRYAVSAAAADVDADVVTTSLADPPDTDLLSVTPPALGDGALGDGALGDAALPGYNNGVTGVQTGHSRLAIPGAFIGDTVAADWYFPTQVDGSVDAQGVIWLQHGFGATNTFYSALATDLAKRTNSIVVAPTLSSIPFTLSGGCLTCDSTEQAAAAAFLDPNRAALVNSAVAAGYTGDTDQLLGKFALAGHSAGGGFSIAVASDYVSAGTADQDEDLVGVVMYDGVSNDAFGTGFAQQVGILAAAGKPTYQIAAPAQAWNAFGVTTNTLAAVRPGQFTGVVLSGGSHVDSMLGVNPLFDAVLQLVTQQVPAGNTAAVYTLGTGWLNDMYAGNTPQDAEYGFYAGANEAIMMGPTSAIGLPTLAANNMSFGDRLLTSVLGMFGLTLPPPVTVVPNGVTGVVVPPLSNGVTGIRTGSSVLLIPSGDNGYPAPADWYFPTQADGTVAANGVIWLQHGFLGFKEWYADMAIALAQETNSIVVVPFIYWFDNPISPGSFLGSQAVRVAATEMFQGDRTELNASANAAGLQGPLPEKFILTGHSAGGNFATAVGALITETPEVANLLGVVMFDGVSRPPVFTDQLQKLIDAGIPDYQIAAPAQRWNAYGVATEAMYAKYAGQFYGTQIDNGSHSDVISGSGLLADLGEILSDIIVKPSPPGGKAAVRTFATGWVNDMYSGVFDPTFPFYGFYGNPNDGTYVENQSIAMGPANAATLPSPPPVDINQYAGTWYEQGSVRQFFSVGLVNTKAVYTPRPDGSVRVQNSGNYFFANGPAVNIDGSAVPVNAFNTRLNVGFGGIFGGEPSNAEPGNYWILDYAPDYSWVIVSDPSFVSGFILTRDQIITDEEYEQLKTRAQELGVSGLILRTRQFPPTEPGAALPGPAALPSTIQV